MIKQATRTSSNTLVIEFEDTVTTISVCDGVMFYHMKAKNYATVSGEDILVAFRSFFNTILDAISGRVTLSVKRTNVVNKPHNGNIWQKKWILKTQTKWFLQKIYPFWLEHYKALSYSNLNLQNKIFNTLFKSSDKRVVSLTNYKALSTSDKYQFDNYKLCRLVCAHKGFELSRDWRWQFLYGNKLNNEFLDTVDNFKSNIPYHILSKLVKKPIESPLFKRNHILTHIASAEMHTKLVDISTSDMVNKAIKTYSPIPVNSPCVTILTQAEDMTRYIPKNDVSNIVDLAYLSQKTQMTQLTSAHAVLDRLFCKFIQPISGVVALNSTRDLKNYNFDNIILVSEIDNYVNYGYGLHKISGYTIHSNGACSITAICDYNKVGGRVDTNTYNVRNYDYSAYYVPNDKEVEFVDYVRSLSLGDEENEVEDLTKLQPAL